MLTTDEKATARTIHTIMHPLPCRDLDGLRAAMRASREKHGERHEVIKWYAMHARADQLA